MSRSGKRVKLEPLTGYFVGLDSGKKRHYLSPFHTEYPLRGFLLPIQFASVLRTILRTPVTGCAEEKVIALTQGGRAPEVAKPRDKRLKRIDDDRALYSLTVPINKALAPVTNWDYASRRLSNDDSYSYHHLFRSPCIV